MTRTVYVNGDYLPEGEAKVSIFDRGFLMADGVYEVTSVLEGKLIDFDGHVKRLERSLKELEMSCPVSSDALLAMHRELVSGTGSSRDDLPADHTRQSRRPQLPVPRRRLAGDDRLHAGHPGTWPMPLPRRPG